MTLGTHTKYNVIWTGYLSVDVKLILLLINNRTIIITNPRIDATKIVLVFLSHWSFGRMVL